MLNSPKNLVFISDKSHNRGGYSQMISGLITLMVAIVRGLVDITVAIIRMVASIFRSGR